MLMGSAVTANHVKSTLAIIRIKINMDKKTSNAEHSLPVL